MGGWMDGWVGGWVDGWIGGWVDGWVDSLAWYHCNNKFYKLFSIRFISKIEVYSFGMFLNPHRLGVSTML